MEDVAGCTVPEIFWQWNISEKRVLSLSLNISDDDCIIRDHYVLVKMLKLLHQSYVLAALKTISLNTMVTIVMII